MIEKFLHCYSLIFNRKCFYYLNKLLFHCGLRGLGILNYYSFKLSGEKNFLKTTVTDGQYTFIDVGANIGLYTKKVLKLNSNSRCYLFEPVPQTFEELQNNITPSLNIKMTNKALGKSEGNIKIYNKIEAGTGTHATPYKDVINEIHNSELVEMNLPVTTLDKFCSENNIDQIDLLKIDTEGHELEVLLGATKLISDQKIKTIHIEFNEMNVYSKAFLRDFIILLKDYDVFRMVQDGLLPLKQYKPVYYEIFAYQNIVFKRIEKDEQ